LGRARRIIDVSGGSEKSGKGGHTLPALFPRKSSGSTWQTFSSLDCGMAFEIRPFRAHFSYPEFLVCDQSISITNVCQQSLPASIDHLDLNPPHHCALLCFHGSGNKQNRTMGRQFDLHLRTDAIGPSAVQAHLLFPLCFLDQLANLIERYFRQCDVGRQGR
jgi:hypothetical protein